MGEGEEKTFEDQGGAGCGAGGELPTAGLTPGPIIKEVLALGGAPRSSFGTRTPVFVGRELEAPLVRRCRPPGCPCNSPRIGGNGVARDRDAETLRVRRWGPTDRHREQRSEPWWSQGPDPTSMNCGPHPPGGWRRGDMTGSSCIPVTLRTSGCRTPLLPRNWVLPEPHHHLGVGSASHRRPDRPLDMEAFEPVF